MAVIIHRGSSFVVATEGGEIEPGTDHGFFVDDTRFLGCFSVRIDGQRPLTLGACSPRPEEARHFLANPELREASRSTLAILLRRIVAGGLHTDVEVENYGDREANATLRIGFGADFEYVLTVKKQASRRGLDSQRPPIGAKVEGGGRCVTLCRLDGKVARETVIAFGAPPGFLDAASARWALRLAPRERFHLCIDVTARLGDRVIAPGHTCASSADAKRESTRVQRQREQVREAAPTLETDCDALRRAYSRAVADFALLRIKSEGEGIEEGIGAIAGGIPWFMDLFGRDSLIASIESMLQDPQLARRTLVCLARLQGTKTDSATEEEPGKILHEHRAGPVPPLARRDVPGYPFYATVDATPLFLIALSEHARVTGDVSLARELWPNVIAALDWMSRDGDRDGDGLLEYRSSQQNALQNHCWKDSDDSIRFHDGRLAEAPIAVVEAQGYAFDARVRTAELARLLGHRDLADDLDRRAGALRERIGRLFWMEDRGTFALALDARKRRVDALTSNPGHLLFCGAVTRAQAARVASTLLGAEMFSGYGIRTMGAREAAFNPMSYHNGSVWPHDNALALAGLVRYALRDEAATLAEAWLAALEHFEDAQTPELFCGFDRERAPVPVPYPQANKPQAWASGAVLLLVRSVLGLSIDALARRIAVRPLPMRALSRLSLRGVPCGNARIDVHFDARRSPAVRVEGVPAGFGIDAGA